MEGRGTKTPLTFRFCRLRCLLTARPFSAQRWRPQIKARIRHQFPPRQSTREPRRQGMWEAPQRGDRNSATVRGCRKSRKNGQTEPRTSVRGDPEIVYFKSFVFLRSLTLPAPFHSFETSATPSSRSGEKAERFSTGMAGPQTAGMPAETRCRISAKRSCYWSSLLPRVILHNILSLLQLDLYRLNWPAAGEKNVTV